jgi:hypothetical protein
VTIPNIDFINAGALDKGGQLVVKVESSSYNTTSLRDAMIKSAALTAQKGSEGAHSCYDQPYASVFKRKLPFSLSRSRLFARYLKRDRPEATEQQAHFCNTASFAGVQYFSPEWRQAKNPGAQAFIDANWAFKVGPGGSFECDFIEALQAGLAVFAPEFAGADLALEPEVNAFCEQVFNNR